MSALSYALAATSRPQPSVQTCARLITNLSVHISGSTSDMLAGGGVNGIFSPTQQVLCGATVFVKQDEPSVCLRYYKGPQQAPASVDVALPPPPLFSGWLIQDVSDQGTTRSKATLRCERLVWPHESASCWKLLKEGATFHEQPAVKAKMVLYADPSLGVCIAGVTAPDMCDERKASRVNGMYVPTQEFVKECTLYRKAGDPDTFLVMGREWKITDEEDMLKHACWASLKFQADTNFLPHEAPPGKWRIGSGGGGGFVDRPSVTCTSFLLASCGVDISGVTPSMTAPSTASSLNGFYEPVLEIFGGVQAYRKQAQGGSSDVYITYNAAAGGPTGWVMQSAANKGTPRGFAHLLCGRVLLHKVEGGVWNVVEGEQEGVASFRGQSGDRLQAAILVEQQHPGLNDEEFLRRVEEWLAV